MFLNRGRNLIINGAFDYWQRNTSFAAAADGVYTADRFIYRKNGTMVHTVSRDTDVPTLAQAGCVLPYSLRLNLTTAQAVIGASDSCRIEHRIEGQVFAQARNKKFTLSFWVKAPVTGIYSIMFRTSGNDVYYVTEYTVQAANTWEKKKITVQHSDALGTWDYGNGQGLQINWALACGTTPQATTLNAWTLGSSKLGSVNQVNALATVSTDFKLAGVMLHEGEVAAGFDRAGKDPIGELALCQRYFEKSYDVDTAVGTVTAVGEYMERSDSTSSRHPISFKVQKRTTPAGVIYNPTTGAAGSWRDDTTPANRTGSISNPGESAATIFISTGSTGDLLHGHWAVDAEL